MAATNVDIQDPINNDVLTYTNGIWTNQQPLSSLLTAKGELITCSTPPTPTTLAVGTDGYLLTADSTSSVGISWKQAPTPLPTSYNFVFTGTNNTSIPSSTGSTWFIPYFNTLTLNGNGMSQYSSGGTLQYVTNTNSAGTWLMSVTIPWETPSAATMGLIRLYSTSGSIQRLMFQSPLPTSGSTTQCWTFVYVWGANESLMIQVQQSSGSNLNIDGELAGVPGLQWSGTRIM